ncbi:MAG: deoxyguanosinetriphosphate triphosphohydrolase [Pseudomonadota bacterium]
MGNRVAESIPFQPLEGRALAPYAAKQSRGRLLAEPSSPTRSEFQRDRDRIIHSDAFRRLMHKTQVFVHNASPGSEHGRGDHFRTRLTHSIEVGQIARALARALRADEDLAEALALVHDFGHTPFGHAGERVLERKLAQFGGFEHNAQSLRIVTQLERRYASFDGLNLTWETLEGLIKHNGPITDRDGDGLEGPVPKGIADYNRRHDLWLWSWPSVEAQCAAIADDIAYDNHDLDDGLRAGLFTLDDVAHLTLTGRLLAQVREKHSGLESSRMIYEVVRRQTTAMVEDVIREASGRLTHAAPRKADDVRRQDYAMVAFSPEMEAQEKEVKAFLLTAMYRSEEVMRPVRASEQIVSDLFDRYLEEPSAMPQTQEWSMDGLDVEQRHIKVTDYISGMTDRYAILEHRRLFDATPALR